MRKKKRKKLESILLKDREKSEDHEKSEK